MYTDATLVGDTTIVKENCDAISAGAVYYQSLVDELKTARNDIITNWEGDAATDLTQVTTRIDYVLTEFSGMILTLTQLSNGAYKLAEVTESHAGNTVEGGTGGTFLSSDPSGADVTFGPEAPKTESNDKPTFWEFHGENFAEAWTSQNWGEAWDYSGCDSGLDYVGKTVDALVDSTGNVIDATIDTVGATVNFVVDGASEFLGWLFG